MKKVKSWLRDQAFYAKELANHSSEAVITTTKLSALGVFIILMTLSANMAHMSFIESKVGSNVVLIRSPEDAPLKGSATGFEMKAPSGKIYTITNAHVCGLANSKGIIMVEDKLHSGRLLPKRVIEVYKADDLCIVDGLEGYEGLTVGSEPTIGQSVIAIGYPHCMGISCTIISPE